MPQNWQQHPNNDVEVRSESTLHITLCMRGASSQDGSKARTVLSLPPPEAAAFLPIRTAPPAMHSEIAGRGRFWCGTMDVINAEAQNPLLPSVPIQQETPTFTFGKPPFPCGSAVECPPPIMVEERVKADPGEVMFPSCGRYSPPPRPTNAASRPEYDDATMEDFRRHLGVIDCRGSYSAPCSNPSPYPPTEGSQNQNHALQDYQTQLMLLEQAKRERDMMRRQEMEHRGCYPSNIQPYHVPATEDQASQHCQIQPTMMEEQGKELEQARRGLGENTQQAWNVPSRYSVQVDHQRQLMLLEQQNKHRLMQARMNRAAYTPEERSLARERFIREMLAEQARYHPPSSGLPTVPFSPDKPEERAEDSYRSDEDGELKIYDHESSPSTAAETTDKEATPAPSTNPPLPTGEEPPPLPNEAPPDQPADDGWAAVWDDGVQAFYFYNRFTQATQWENPRVPQPSQPRQPSGPPGVENYPSSVEASQAPPSRQVGGYDPAIHGDYDPNADYAKAYEIPSTDDDGVGGLPGTNTADLYEATGTFNRFTGKWQRADLNPEKFTDEQKSKRQMNAFFDVDLAANSHNGKSLRAERQSQKLSKAELKAFKEKRREKKEEKRRAWLRD